MLSNIIEERLEIYKNFERGFQSQETICLKRGWWGSEVTGLEKQRNLEVKPLRW